MLAVGAKAMRACIAFDSVQILLYELCVLPHVLNVQCRLLVGRGLHRFGVLRDLLGRFANVLIQHLQGDLRRLLSFHKVDLLLLHALQQSFR